MNITGKLNKKSIEDKIKAFQKQAHSNIKNKLVAVAERFVSDARLTADFTDRTGQLRSSIGALIAYDGKVIYRNFEQGPRGSDPKPGITTARQIAEKKVASYPRGYLLLTIAGMGYAAYLETRGYSVLTGSSQEATAALNKAFNTKK